MCRHRIVVTAQRTNLNGDARKTMLPLLHGGILFGRQLRHKALRRAWRVTTAAFHIVEAAVELLARNGEPIAKSGGIERRRFAFFVPPLRCCNQHIVGRVVIYEQFAVAVVDKPAWRINGAPQQSVAIGLASP